MMRRFLRILVLAALAAGLLAAPTTARAEEQTPQVCPICENLRKQNLVYGDKVANTFGRGLLNFTLGWTELIRQPAKKARAEESLWHGFANGVGKSAVRTARGLGEILTFWTPKMNGEYVHFSEDCPLDTIH